MNIKKTLAGVASYALIGAVAFGVAGTLAQPSTSDEDVNTYTVGNIDIVQNEYEREFGTDGKVVTLTEKDSLGYYPDKLIEFDQGKMLTPAFYSGSSPVWDNRKSADESKEHYQSWEQIGAPGSCQLFDADIPNIEDKFVSVQNVGENPCYYRTIIAVEHPKGLSCDGIRLNKNGYKAFDWNQVEPGNQDPKTGNCEVINDVYINGVRYYVIVATYTDQLNVNEVSRPSLLQLYMVKEMTSEEYALYGDTVDIRVATQAVEAMNIAEHDKVEGKSDAQVMLEAAFNGPISATNHPWLGKAENVGSEAGVSLDDLLKNSNVTDDMLVLNVKDKVTLTTGAEYGSTTLGNEYIDEIVLQGTGEKATFVATGAGVGEIMNPNGRLVFKDMTIVDESVSYKEDSWEFTYLEFGGELYFENCTFTSGIQLVKSANATFVNCKFISEAKSEYSVWVCDGDATFVNCEFTGTRALKMHEDYGSDIKSVLVDRCTFGPLTEKPGVVIGNINVDPMNTSVIIKDSTFNKCQAGDQEKYIYESDTDVEKFAFSSVNNTVVK